METIAYIAPSSAGSIEHQMDLVRPHVTDDRHIRVDRPEKPGGPIPRIERDFVFTHMLHSAADNPDGKPARLVVASMDVLGDNRAEVTELFGILVRLGVQLVSLTDGLDGDATGTAYVVKWVKALERAEARWRRLKNAERPKRKPRDGAVAGGRPRALAPAEIDEVVRLKEVSQLTWPQIETHFRTLGRTVKQSTLRAYYARARMG